MTHRPRGPEQTAPQMSPRRKDSHLVLKGTRTAMSFVAEARRLGISHPYPEAGQAGYSAMADVLARAVLFANWEVVGAGALVRAGSVVRVVEMGLLPPFRSDEFMRRITWRLLADAAHDLIETPEIEDAYRRPLDITRFIARRRATRAEDSAAPPIPIGRIEIPLGPVAGKAAAGAGRGARPERDGTGEPEPMPRAPKRMSL